MKRYIALISMIVLVLGVLVAIFLLLIGQDNSYITYIKLQVNPSFVIGINENKNVVFYNSLNEDGNKYNLSMFQGKSLGEATKIFIEKLGNAKEDKNEINLTIMTKNNNLTNELFNIIKNEINSFDSNYLVISHEPTNEEMERYSNENVYNLENSLKNNDLKIISKSIYDKVDNYIVNKINNLKLNKIKSEEKIKLLKEKQEDGYFNDFNIQGIVINDCDVSVLEKSNYTVLFTFEEDFTYSYKIILNLEIEFEKEEKEKIVEVYKYSYELGEDIELIRDLKTYYYAF